MEIERTFWFILIRCKWHPWLYLLEIFQLGESLISNTRPFDQPPAVSEKGTENVEIGHRSPKSPSNPEFSGENHGESASDDDTEDDASSSITVTSPKASECPPTVKISTDMQLIGNINKSRKNDSISKLMF